ncbi:hypothetical protein Riv7116_4658 [Rivularia sp. PCC 7116]|uniref:hypothetical protein n=1 Tax=Rivularia sp. PCC 7116 TaxID=373994 RepID=UPI00029F168B|nr:hypothetical protein [Rivularia sp. PCC 7116]AFY57077.1 hypothetical protein Riv7116_4658 [Rivularia sp. PCC 7116]
MNKKQSRLQFSNGDNHTMLSALLKIGGAGISVAIAVLGSSTICSSPALAADSDEKVQLSIGSRLKESLNTAKEVKGQDVKSSSTLKYSEASQSERIAKKLKKQDSEVFSTSKSKTALPVGTGKKIPGEYIEPDLISEPSNISPSLEESVKLAEIGDDPVAPISPGSSGSGSMFDQGGSLFERQQQPQPQIQQQQQPQPQNQNQNQDQQTQAEPLNPLQEDSTPARRRNRSEVQLEITPIGDPVVQADGRSTIQIRGQIINKEGEVIPRDVEVTLTSSAGKFIGSDQNKDAPGFQARAINGEFIATLQSGLKAQPVRIRAAVHKIKKPASTLRQRERAIDGEEILESGRDTRLFNNELVSQPIEAYTQVEFTTYLRPSLVTGIINLRVGARGTNFWGSRREFLDPDADDGTEVDLDSQIFATGKVGEWLFTGAFNSERPINQDCEGRNRLFGGIQFCEQNYPVYGDSSTVTPTTPSIDSFYARFERSSKIPGGDPDYAMWGDYRTEEFSRPSQLYGGTSRALHGFKGNYSLGPLQITGLYANNVEGFQRDTFTPQGISGNYFLSRRLLVPGSESVYLEAEEINRPGTIVKRQQLYRGRDYDIDYDRGTIRLLSPILATELNAFGATLQRQVVVTYQPEDDEDGDIYGGRVQFNISQNYNSKSFIAGSYLREDQGDRDFELYGADFLLSFGRFGRILGEYARSESDTGSGDELTGNAYRIEAIGNLNDRINLNAYYRSVEENFNNNATFSFSPGQTRYGAGLLAKLTNTTTLGVSYDVEENFGRASTGLVNFFDLFDPQPQARPGEALDNELKTFRAGILQKLGFADASVEYVNRSREDSVNNELNGDAEQIVSRLKVPLTQSLTFQAQNEANIDGSDPLYPNRTTLGLDWQAFEGVTFRLAHQWYDDTSLLEGNSLTTLDTLVDYNLAKDTTFNGRYSVLSGFNGLQGQGALGVNHGMPIAPGLRLSLGYQYVFRNIFNSTAAGDRIPQYYAVGQDAASLGLFAGSVYSVGLDYTDNPDFKASGRFEFRDGDEGETTFISVGAAGKITPALTALARFQQAGEANVFLPSSVNNFGAAEGVRFEELGDTANLKIGLAYRDPTNDKFNGLLKYEWRQNFDSIPENQFTGSSTATGHVFSAEAIYAPSWRWEFFGKYALRNGVTYFDGDRYDGTVNLAQARASYKLGYRTDLAVEGRWIGQNSNNNADFDEFGIAVEGGYYLTPDLRLGVGYAFGSVDDRDFTGYRSEGGLYLNVSLKLNELFGGFGLQKPVPKQEQESEVSPLVRDGSQTQSKKPQTKLSERLKKNQSQELVNRLKKQGTEQLPTSNTQSRIPQNKASRTKLINNLKN